jgi:hypothetical protein
MTATESHEKDAMVCRRCGKEDRASEGYPCASCGTFLCLICSFRGYQYCLRCEQQRQGAPPTP